VELNVEADKYDLEVEIDEVTRGSWRTLGRRSQGLFELHQAVGCNQREGFNNLLVMYKLQWREN